MSTPIAPVALASFPRSGNTWLRYMIEKTTGERSRSIYCDRVLTRPRHGVVIKTHAMNSWEYDKAIHLIRNPLDAIYSFYNWKMYITNRDINWPGHVQDSILLWKAHTEHWVSVQCPTLRIRYEDLLIDTCGQLEQVLSFLGKDHLVHSLNSVASESTINKMRGLSSIGEKFFRKGISGEGSSHFSTAERAFVEKECADLIYRHSCVS